MVTLEGRTFLLAALGQPDQRRAKFERGPCLVAMVIRWALSAPWRAADGFQKLQNTAGLLASYRRHATPCPPLWCCSQEVFPPLLRSILHSPEKRKKPTDA
ncbi:unnamed protein product [Eretmochelys imbricata]